MTECENIRSLADVSGLTVETVVHASSSSQQHGIFPDWSGAGWIPPQSGEEVMTQEGAKPAADDPGLTRFSYFSLADSENCVFPLAR